MKVYHPSRKTLAGAEEEARETKRITIAVKEVESKGYEGANAGIAGEIFYQNIETLKKYLYDYISQRDIDFEGFNEPEE